MNQTANAKERHTIPRWNSLNISSRLGELNPAVTCTRKSEIAIEDELAVLLDKWSVEKSIPLAVEIISSIEMSNSDIPIEEYSIYIKGKLSSLDYIPPMLSDVLLHDESNHVLVDKDWGIREIRQSLFRYPYNPLLWSELSREYLIHGHIEKSEHAIRTAYNLAPNNRTVLRAISRLYAHKRDYDQASFYLRKTPLVKVDPWVLSAEIAISSEAGKTSKYIKTGQKMLENANYDVYSLSELGSELATLDFFSANEKQGKRKIERISPMLHENAAAQIVWLDEHVYKIPHIIYRLQTPECNYEAEAILEVGNHNWQKAVDNALKWHNYQPFSSDPTMLISYLMSDYLLEYQKACDVLCEAIKANPRNVELLNNYAYASSVVGNLDLAADLLKRAKKIYPSESYVPIIATEGLLYYRQGNTEAGKAMYEKAVLQAKKINDPKTLFQVYLNYAREEKLCGNSIDGLIEIINGPKFLSYKSEFEDVISNFGLKESAI